MQSLHHYWSLQVSAISINEWISTNGGKLQSILRFTSEDLAEEGARTAPDLRVVQTLTQGYNPKAENLSESYVPIGPTVKVLPCLHILPLLNSDPLRPSTTTAVYLKRPLVQLRPGFIDAMTTLVEASRYGTENIGMSTTVGASASSAAAAASAVTSGGQGVFVNTHQWPLCGEPSMASQAPSSFGETAGTDAPSEVTSEGLTERGSSTGLSEDRALVREILVYGRTLVQTYSSLDESVQTLWKSFWPRPVTAVGRQRSSAVVKRGAALVRSFLNPAPTLHAREDLTSWENELALARKIAQWEPELVLGAAHRNGPYQVFTSTTKFQAHLTGITFQVIWPNKQYDIVTSLTASAEKLALRMASMLTNASADFLVSTRAALKVDYLSIPTISDQDICLSLRTHVAYPLASRVLLHRLSLVSSSPRPLDSQQGPELAQWKQANVPVLMATDKQIYYPYWLPLVHVKGKVSPININASVGDVQSLLSIVHQVNAFFARGQNAADNQARDVNEELEAVLNRATTTAIPLDSSVGMYLLPPASNQPATSAAQPVFSPAATLSASLAKFRRDTAYVGSVKIGRICLLLLDSGSKYVSSPRSARFLSRTSRSISRTSPAARRAEDKTPTQETPEQHAGKRKSGALLDGPPGVPEPAVSGSRISPTSVPNPDVPLGADSDGFQSPPDAFEDDLGLDRRVSLADSGPVSARPSLVTKDGREFDRVSGLPMDLLETDAKATLFSGSKAEELARAPRAGEIVASPPAGDAGVLLRTPEASSGARRERPWPETPSRKMALLEKPGLALYHLKSPSSDCGDWSWSEEQCAKDAILSVTFGTVEEVWLNAFYHTDEQMQNDVFSQELRARFYALITLGKGQAAILHQGGPNQEDSGVSQGSAGNVTADAVRRIWGPVPRVRTTLRPTLRIDELYVLLKSKGPMIHCHARTDLEAQMNLVTLAAMYHRYVDLNKAAVELVTLTRQKNAALVHTTEPIRSRCPTGSAVPP
ncbi:hypothetical protein GNI_038740 [Gregarina niphandrodes]|uniref:Uncharacterized protein n=1 Tax=Gregarina niphandrodes TaxID=110365 RepID=A0A023BAJ0_GRENI|nr:hypothetical protein GNI_038740 [Gregarina niphandrodes]EZG78280.1 hypothetical protein GNI_038740 [Gregarina niphandrodes]|eukprot:XP_011129366.1 hypothetical protein GNI_038740 [Gregarina niphandrodes]